MEKQNGIITEYSIKYTAVGGEDDKPHEILGIPSDTTKYLLEQLEKWMFPDWILEEAHLPT